MKELKPVCRVAVVQAAPVMFDKAACLEKALALTAEAAQNGAELVVFPELFIPCYPYGMTFGFTVGHREESGRRDWLLYYDNSLLVPGPETAQLRGGMGGTYIRTMVEEGEGKLFLSNEQGGKRELSFPVRNLCTLFCREA